jgi:hypothetical protein
MKKLMKKLCIDVFNGICCVEYILISFNVEPVSSVVLKKPSHQSFVNEEGLDSNSVYGL